MPDKDKNQIRVRFAPSPTGFLHIGTARSTLFNWLFARHNNGVFVLRIEDTDKERSKKEFEDDLIAGLNWLGLNWDEGPDIGGPYGPYRQSERGGIYKNYLEQMLSQGKAYYCFCSKEDLEAEREAMINEGLSPKYSGRCRHLEISEVEKRLANGEKAVIRMKAPETKVEFTDLIRGRMVFDASLIGDVIIAKDLDNPLFILSNAIDDYEMKITHAIRGEDHIANTPKQILIQQALGFNEIKYAHLPLILSADKSKLSKRYIETSLNDYRKQGYLPDALINFFALLGWHPEKDREILSREELIQEFDLSRVQKSGAIFNPEKLNWLNAEYIKKMTDEALLEEIKAFISEEWLKDENGKMLKKIVRVEKNRLKKLSDIVENIKFFYQAPEYEKELLIWKETSQETIKENLLAAKNELEKISDNEWNEFNLKNAINSLSESRGRGEVFWPLRVALSGQSASPGPIEIMDILEKNNSMERINKALQKLSG